MPRPNRIADTITTELATVKQQIAGHEQAIHILTINRDLLEHLAKVTKATAKATAPETPATTTAGAAATTTNKPGTRKPRRKKGTAAVPVEPAPTPQGQVIQGVGQVGAAPKDPEGQLTFADITTPVVPAKQAHTYKCPECGHEFDAPMQFTDGPHCPKCEKPFTIPVKQ